MILVVGATGQLGGMITHKLLQNGEIVSILVRKNSLFEKMVDAGAQPVYGDIKEPQTLVSALYNVDVLITTATATARGGDDTVESVDRRGNKNLIETAQTAGVSQFIFISAFPADENSPNPFFNAKAESESRLIASGMSYTIIAPDFFMETWVEIVVGMPLQNQQPITLVSEANRKHSLLSARDAAGFAVAAVGHEGAVNQRLEIGGPQALSWKEVVQLFEEVLGRKLPVEYISPGELIPGFPEVIAAELARMETFDSIIPMEEMARQFGVEMTSLEELVKARYVSSES